jgi:hypothetical protein
LAIAHFTANRREASRVSQAHLFTRLEASDRNVLAHWLEDARRHGVDAVIDLTVRPWNIACTPIIVGIFEKNRAEASWLIVHCPDGWMLANCTDGSILGVCAALLDILALIEDAPRCYPCA